MQVRAWQDENLPIEFSLLAYDLLICACFHTVSGLPLNYKQIFLTLPYSKNGIRNQLNKFIAEGWLEIRHKDADARVRYVVALPKLLDVLNDYLAVREIHGYRTEDVLVVDQDSSVS
jgi:hypothetical protein